MFASIEDFKTGWYGIAMGLKEEEIDKLIEGLRNIKERKHHFHFRSDFEGEGGVGDVEIYYMDGKEKDNMKLEL